MFDNENSNLSEHLVTINRVAKVVKGGRRFGFAAIVIVGDTKGKVGYGTGKAKEVPEAIRKATDKAKINLIKQLELTEIQAQAILDMQLRRLAALERQKLDDEYQVILNTIKELEELLGDPSKLYRIVFY